MHFPRRSGVLLHITSLPSDFGIGDLGPNAYKFVEWLRDTDQKLWQILPISYADNTGSPYSAFSAFGGYPMLISPELLVIEGLLKPNHLKNKENFSDERVNYDQVRAYKKSLFKIAFENFNKGKNLHQEFAFFLETEKSWLDDFAIFLVISEQYGNYWVKWPERLKERNHFALDLFVKMYKEEILFQKFLQFMFFRQWDSLKEFANKNGIHLIGDIPIFVSHHSVDVWKYPQWFKMDKNGELSIQAGAAPDMFSATGQKWGNPNYNWSIMEQDGFSWWIARMRFMMRHFDIIRLDHFRGFEAVWEVRTDAPNALNGWWAYSPGYSLFNTMKDKLGDLPIIGEDLGEITQAVRDMRDYFNMPGMKILQMGFGSGDTNAHLPHNYTENCVVYTGTHDNNTSKGYFHNLPDGLEKIFVHAYLQRNTLHWINWDLIALAMHSRAHTAITPLQDIMGLGQEARFNTPGSIEGNWTWRFKWENLKEDDRLRFKEITFHSYRNRYI